MFSFSAYKQKKLEGLKKMNRRRKLTLDLNDEMNEALGFKNNKKKIITNVVSPINKHHKKIITINDSDTDTTDSDYDVDNVKKVDTIF